jgi:hypothetical protein
LVLNLALSWLAAQQGGALQIASNRGDAINSEVALHTERTADEVKELLERNNQLTEALQQLTAEVHAKLLGS